MERGKQWEDKEEEEGEERRKGEVGPQLSHRGCAYETGSKKMVKQIVRSRKYSSRLLVANIQGQMVYQITLKKSPYTSKCI